LAGSLATSASMLSLGDKIEVPYHVLHGKEQADRTKPLVLCTVQRILGDDSLQVFRDDVSTKKLLPSLEKAATEGGLSASYVTQHWPSFFHRTDSDKLPKMIGGFAPYMWQTQIISTILMRKAPPDTIFSITGIQSEMGKTRLVKYLQAEFGALELTGTDLAEDKKTDQ